MLGRNPSADLVASTDAGDATPSPFRYLTAETHYRERHQSAKSWGWGGKAPASICRCRKLPSEAPRPLIMRALAIVRSLITDRRSQNPKPVIRYEPAAGRIVTVRWF